MPIRCIRPSTELPFTSGSTSVSAPGSMAAAAAAAACRDLTLEEPDRTDVDREKERLYAPLFVKDGMDWRELNKAVSKAMQNYCGGIKNDMLLRQGLELLASYEKDWVPALSCKNPHELMRAHEVMDILEVCKLILNACLLRKSSSAPLCFERSDYPEMDPKEDQCFITIYQEDGEIRSRRVPKEYYGDVKTGYEACNQDYIRGKLSLRQGRSAAASTR